MQLAQPQEVGQRQDTSDLPASRPSRRASLIMQRKSKAKKGQKAVLTKRTRGTKRTRETRAAVSSASEEEEGEEFNPVVTKKPRKSTKKSTRAARSTRTVAPEFEAVLADKFDKARVFFTRSRLTAAVRTRVLERAGVACRPFTQRLGCSTGPGSSASVRCAWWGSNERNRGEL